MANHAGEDRNSDGARPWIVWFRDDLRLDGHAPLRAAAQRGMVLPVFIIEDKPRRRALGAAARWWQKVSLAELSEAISADGGRLLLLRGTPKKVLPELAAAVSAAGVCCHRVYDAAGRKELDSIARALSSQVTFEALPGDCLAEPGSVLTQAGEPFRVFTPFWRALRRHIADGDGFEAGPPDVDWYRTTVAGEALDVLAVPEEQFGWTRGLADTWQPGEAAAHAALELFAADAIATYEDDRNLPAQRGTSRLSPHLRFGEIGVRAAWDRIEAIRSDSTVAPAQCEAWLRELGWREFCRHLMFHFPELATKNFRSEFDAFRWRDDAAGLRAWQRGETGYPLVDAGMRELWNTGWMHNRVRMVVASFLTKHLRIHWQRGEIWFWDTLVDADYASNPANWQWTAGTGADAAPYFRIFNPTTQAQKFDRAGEYIRRWVPELAALPDMLLHQPWAAGDLELAAAGVQLGETYPRPLVDHAEARAAALAAHAALRSGRSS